MQATADSSTINRIWAVINDGNNNQEDLTTWLPRRVNRRCPAIILAANRTESVIGRMMFLINSMITMNGIRTGGVPVGIKCAKNSVRLLIRLNKINPNHKGRAKDSVIVRCLVAVKVKDSRPKVLLNKITINNLRKMIIFAFLFFKRMENSFFMALIVFLIRFLYGEDKTQ